MVYMQEASIVYDTILFGVLHFNEDECIKTHFGLLDRENFSLYHKYKDRTNFVIRDSLCPFYNYDSDKLSFLTRFLIARLEAYNICNYNLDSFIRDILDRQFYHYALIYFMKDDTIENDIIEDK
jgi:hypothetical protein